MIRSFSLRLPSVCTLGLPGLELVGWRCYDRDQDTRDLFQCPARLYWLYRWWPTRWHLCTEMEQVIGDGGYYTFWIRGPGWQWGTVFPWSDLNRNHNADRTRATTALKPRATLERHSAADVLPPNPPRNE